MPAHRRLARLTIALIAMVACCPLAFAEDAADVELEDAIATAPVELDGFALFRVRGTSSYPADRRARAIGERLAAVARDDRIPIESLHVSHGPVGSRIIARDQPVMTILDADAALEHVQRFELAAIHLARVRQALVDYRAARSARALQRDAINSAIATALFTLSILALVWFWRWIDRLVDRRVAARIHAFEIHSFEVMRAEQIASGLRRALTAARAIGFVVIGFVYLQVVLAQWPSTRLASRSMTGFVLAPLQVLGSGLVSTFPRVMFLAVLFIIVRWLIRIIHLFFEAVGRRSVGLSGFDPEWAEPTYRIVRLLVAAFGLVVAYPYIPGSGSAAFKGLSVFVGVMFSLGSSSAISNMIAGYMMIYRRAFKVGDRVKIGDAFGEVLETRLQVTHIRSIKNEEIVIPNSQILSSQVINYSSLARTRGLILHTEVGIGYETSWRQVEAMLLEAAARTHGIASDPSPFILEKELGAFAVVYELNAYCSDAQSIHTLYAELHRNTLDVFNEHGVQIMTPAYECDPAEPKVAPAKDLVAASR
jgi:small-conductance mechanosensitive channel